MCGINGIIDPFGTRDLFPLIKKMNTVLTHRGPDNEGVFCSDIDRLALGHTRLSILDLTESGHQPMISEENGNILVFNGEIFNYLELNLKYLSHAQFKSSSDTETILKLYNLLGPKFLEELDGMFSIAIWDKNNTELILARDLSGKKPLYFSDEGSRFSFSSELKGLFELPWIKRDINEKALYDFLTFNFVKTPESIFKGVNKFRAGHVMHVRNGKITKYEPFKTLKKKTIPSISYKHYENDLYDIIERSVRRRMISDVPVGAFLSGGVDSSAVVALMRKFSAQTIKTFTVKFSNQPAYNEDVFAGRVAKEFNTDHYVHEVTKSDTLDFIHNITSIYDEPQSDTTSIPIYFISKLAKESGVKVVLNGDGPDELFAGYDNFSRYNKLNKYYESTLRLPKPLRGLFRSTVNLYWPNSNLSEIGNRLYFGQDLMWPGSTGMKESFKKSLLSPSFIARLGQVNSYSIVEDVKLEFDSFNQGKSADYINWLCFAGYKQSIIERFLFRSDRLGMANSIEARSPFLSDEMVEFALSVPSEWKVRQGINKYIFKKSLERVLPNEILYRKKMGFNLPIREWASETICEFLLTEIDSFSKETGWVNSAAVKNQVEQLKRGNNQVVNNLWTLYFLINWYKKWF